MPGSIRNISYTGIARSVYYRALDMGLARRGTLKPNSVADRALNWLLDFRNQRQRVGNYKSARGARYLRQEFLPQASTSGFSLETAQLVSKFEEICQQTYEGASLFCRTMAKELYIGAQNIGPISRVFLPYRSVADNALNWVLGFDNQQKRLGYLLERDRAPLAEAIFKSITSYRENPDNNGLSLGYFNELRAARAAAVTSRLCKIGFIDWQESYAASLQVQIFLGSRPDLPRIRVEVADRDSRTVQKMFARGIEEMPPLPKYRSSVVPRHRRSDAGTKKKEG